MRRSANKVRNQLADEVLRYLIRHEKAHDTLEGIVAWWLPKLRIETAIVEVEAALRELVASNYVIQRKGRDGRVHYSMNREEVPGIRRRLATKTGELRKRHIERSELQHPQADRESLIKELLLGNMNCNNP